MNVAAYREHALAVAANPQHKLHLLPRVPRSARRILEVGCHAGHILEALRLPEECEVFGCDINLEALQLARKSLPRAQFAFGRAEELPYEDATFDFLFVRAVMAVLDIPAALREFSRVLQPGGTLWLELYRRQDCWVSLGTNFDAHPVKTLAMGAYVLANSVLFHCTGKLVRYPLNRSRLMTFQTGSRMRAELMRAGFWEVKFSRGEYFVVEARKR